MAQFIEQHVHATIIEFLLTQLYEVTGVMDKKKVPLPPRRSSLDATEKATHTLKPENFKKKRMQEEKRSSKLSQAPKKKE